MFNNAIFLKTFRDSRVTLGMAVVGIVAFQILFFWAMLNMGTDLLEFVSKFPFLTKIFEMGFGIKVEGEVSLNILFAVCFTHGVVLALSWGVMIATTTRTTVGEIERGTADMLLGLPVSRPEVYLSTSLVWWLASVFMSFSPLLGIWISTQIFETEEVIEVSRFVAPATNFVFLNLAVGGMSTMISCFLDRRTVAVGSVVAIVLSSVILNFVEPFITQIEKIRFLGLLNYYRPVEVVRTGEWPWENMLVLLVIAVVCWLIGMVTFTRRDIPTA